MKKIMLTLVMLAGGVNLLMAGELENIKAAGNEGLAVNLADLDKRAPALPKPVAKLVECPKPNNNAAVFQGTARWSSDHGFSAVEQLGVRKSAEEKAVANCQAEGLLGCVAIGSTIIACNSDVCGAAGTVFSLVPVTGAEVFSAKMSWTADNGFSPLMQLGVRKSAEEAAVAKCQAKGLLGCVAIGSTIDSCDDYKCTASARAQVWTAPK